MNRSNLHDESGERTGNPKSRPSKPSDWGADQRQPSERLPSRPGRRPEARPPVDPDLERFLTSFESPHAGPSRGQTASGTASQEKNSDSESHSHISKNEEKPTWHSAWPEVRPREEAARPVWSLSTASPDSDTKKDPEAADESTHAVESGDIDAPALPTWKRISETEPDRAARPGRSGTTTTELIRVSQPEPLFPGYAPGQDLDNGDTRKATRILFRRFPLILLVAILIWSAFAVYLGTVPPVYQSSLTMIVDTDGIRTEIDNLPRLTGNPLSAGAPKLANQALFLQTSDELAALVAVRLEQESRSEASINWTLFDRAASSDKSVAEILRSEFVQITSQSGDDNSPDAIVVTAMSTDPREASAIANAYAQTYVARVEQLSRSLFADALNYYEIKRIEQSDIVDSYREGLRVFLQGNGEAVLAEESDRVVSQLTDLQAGLDESRIQIKQHSATVDAISAEMEGMGEQLIAEREAHGIEDQLNETYQRISGLNLDIQQYYTRNPELQEDPSGSADLTRLLSERGSLRSVSDSLASLYANRIVSVGGVDLRSNDGTISYMASMRRRLADARVQLSSSQAREQAILDRLVEYETLLRKLPGQKVALTDFQTKIERETELLSNLDDRILEIEEASNSQQAFAQVISPALVPNSPERNRMLLGVLGLFFGLFLAAGAALVAENVDDRVYDDDQLTKAGLKTTGVIPRHKRSSLRKTTSFGDRRISGELITILEPQSDAARALRAIPVRMSASDRRIQAITVAGVDRGAGSTFVAANTAVALAQSGMKVLLLDGNMYAPKASRLFGIETDASYDITKTSFSEDVGLRAFSSRMPNLYLLTVSGPQDGSADYLLSTNLGGLVDRLRSHFDVIVVDAPSIDESTAALRLSRAGDEILVVARYGSTSVHKLSAAMQDADLTSTHEPHLILNGQSSA